MKSSKTHKARRSPGKLSQTNGRRRRALRTVLTSVYKVAVIVSVSFALIHSVSGFLLHSSPTLLYVNGSKRHRTIPARPLFLSMTPNTNGEKKSDGSQDEDEISVPAKKLKKERCVDFPSFAFSATPSFKAIPYKKQKNLKKAFKVKKLKPTDEALQDQVEDKPSDSLPESSTTQSRATVSPFRFLSDGFTSPFPSPFESDFLRIEKSARQTRLLTDRTYAKRELFESSQLYEPPGLQDLSPPRPKVDDTIWISTPARVSSFLVPYLLFPYLISFLDSYVTMAPAQLDEITSKFGPGVSILYGTFVSLTLSILYNRQQNIQENVAIECSLLGFMTRNLLHVFRKDPSIAIEAGQCVADQIRTLVRGSRGQELMLLMYSDPYGRMLELVENREEELLEKEGDLGVHGSAINSCRDVLKDLSKIRASRLSDEALALPPTHFSILKVLTLLILFGYCITVLPTVDAATKLPSNESSLLFGFLCGIYILFYYFAKDLNDPFRGLYQIRRSSTASHLLQIKWLLVNHPLVGGEIDFEPVQENGSFNEVLVRTPGIGDLWFEKNELFPEVYDADEFDDI